MIRERLKESNVKVMTCPCGEPIRGETDEEFVESVKAHFTESHPQLSGHYTDEQILSRAQDA
jgi:hypothetical protein